MKKLLRSSIFFLFLFFIVQISSAHNGGISGRVVSALDEQTLSNALLVLEELSDSTYSTEDGTFSFSHLEEGEYHIKAVLSGYKEKILLVSIRQDENKEVLIALEEKMLKLKEVIVSGDKDFSTTTRSAIDLRLRPHNSAQDLLRIVPGLFIAQHAGGGKAEQIFLRGFDIDHGTDLNISVDGMPVNMVSHAHGQGYADLHFVIPEIIDKVQLSMGPYRSDVGDFMTAGAVGFKTARVLDRNMIKIEGGRFNNARGLFMTNLLNTNDHKLYVATEYNYNRGYFESSQDFKRFNAFTKYSGNVSPKAYIELSASGFSSSWDASGQVPERAVSSGEISRLGSIDNTEGGNTSRYNANAIFVYTISSADEIRAQVFHNRYNFKLFSNFTFFARDSVNGDQIRQRENRAITGYNVSYSNKSTLGGKKIKTTVGSSMRYDQILNSELSNSRQRVFLSDIKKGNTYETSLSAYIDEQISLSSRISINAGIRYDHFIFEYNDYLIDTTYKEVQGDIINPKLSIFYTPGVATQFFIKTGSGFHSNDARVVVLNQSRRVLPRATGADVGMSNKIFRNLFITTTLWALYSQNEFVYVGDEGIVEVNGRTRRIGADLALRYQITKWLFSDIDFNITDPKYLDEPKEARHVPLAPVLSSIGGLTAKLENNFSFGFRYRYLADRPANEDYTVTAKGYLVNDILVRYTQKHYELFISVENLFNVKWNEAQFDTESRLRDEVEPVSEIHYTPGTPFFLKAGLSYIF